MFTLHIHTIGTTNTAISRHESKADAWHALARFGRNYDIQGYGARDSGTLTSRNGRVNQACYTWRIREI